MNSLIWHIVKKDFRHLRWYLAIWWAVLAASALDVALNVQWIFNQNIDDAPNALATTNENLTMLYWFLMVVDVVVLMMVVDAILKADSPIDERAGWRTRPVGKGRMFRAKLASIALFCFVVPGLFQAAKYLVFGFSVSGLLHQLAQFAVIQGVIVAVIMCAAVLFQRTAKGVLVFIGVFLALLFVVYARDEYYSDDIFFSAVFQPVLAMAVNGWVFPLVIFPAVLAVAGLVYAGRGRRAGCAALACGILLFLNDGFYWINHQENAAPSAAAPVPRNDTLKLSVEPSALFDRTEHAAQWRLYGWINNPALPDLKDSVWLIYSIDSQLNWPGTKPVTIHNSPDMSIPQTVNLPTVLTSRFINAAAAFATAGYGRLAWAPDFWRNVPLIMLDDKQLARLKQEPAQLSANIYVESAHLAHVADVPATVGYTWRTGTTTFRLRSVTRENPTTVQVQLDAVGPPNPIVFPSKGLIYLHPALLPQVYVLYNPQTRECVEGVPGGGYPDNLLIFNWSQTTVYFSFAEKIAPDGLAVPANWDMQALAAWLKDARLAQLRFVYDKNFYFPVTIDHFLLPDKMPADAPATQN